jgi:hypothetical protein
MLAWRSLLAAVITYVVLVPAGDAVGQTAPAEEGSPGFTRRGVTGQLGASVNNVGLQNTIAVVWAKPLSRSSHPLLAGASVSAGVVNVTTPTMTRTGGWVEYAPLSIFAVRAGVEPVGYFGTFSSLMPFDSYDDSYDEDVLFEKQGTKAGVGVRGYITPAIQFRAGPVAARVTADFEHWRSSADGPYFYEATRDQLLASGGDELVNLTGVALYERRVRDGSISAGLFHGLTRVFAAGGNQSQRLGVIAIRQFTMTHFRLPRPSLTAVVYQYLDDPSKKHTWGGAIAIGFQTGR